MRKSETARKGPATIAVTVVRGLIFLGVVASVSACDFNYQPLCSNGCDAGGGDETIGGAQ